MDMLQGVQREFLGSFQAWAEYHLQRTGTCSICKRDWEASWEGQMTAHLEANNESFAKTLSPQNSNMERIDDQLSFPLDHGQLPEKRKMN